MSPQTGETEILIRDLEGTLSNLEGALTDAARAVTAIRSYLPQITALTEVVVAMESALSLARRNLGMTAPATVAPPLRPVPPQEAPPAAAPEDPGKTPHPGAGPQSLRLQVGSKSGSLDLKSVDGAVNENPEVVDVALVDYDGRQATLKLWIVEQSDAAAIGEALEASLRRRLGDDEAEISVEFEPLAA
jgi:hypothetical protein